MRLEIRGSGAAACRGCGRDVGCRAFERWSGEIGGALSPAFSIFWGRRGRERGPRVVGWCRCGRGGLALLAGAGGAGESFELCRGAAGGLSGAEALVGGEFVFGWRGGEEVGEGFYRECAGD